jgi:RND family efflux transporter MFP subunit
MVRPDCVQVVGRSLLIVLIAWGLLLSSARPLFAQFGGRAREPAAAEEPAQVVIEREPLVLRPPETYRVSLHLQPARSVEIAARMDGVVSSILIKSGEAAREQAEIIRLDSRERQLELDRAKAALQAAQIETRGSQSVDDDDVGQARLQIAKIDLELAEYRLDQTILRAPFEGIVQTVHVVEGQFVRAGEPLATLVDTSRLIVQIPVDRAASQVGKSVEIQIEGQGAAGTLQQVLPLTPPFEPLRELFQSIATGVVMVENRAGQWHAGQTVFASLIPRSPVTEVPNRAISNTLDGGRRVQVIRDGFVRDVPIELLAAVGEERTVVTGGFGASDELIVRASEELLDGTQVVARTELVAEPAADTPAPRTPRREIPPVAR